MINAPGFSRMGLSSTLPRATSEAPGSLYKGDGPTIAQP
jgi:hypothetical protein